MEIESQLHLLAEIGAAYTGFIAIFIVFSERGGKFNPSDQHFIQAMIIASMGVILMALIPSTLWYISGSVNWSLYSAIALGIAFFFFIYIGRHHYRMYQEGTDEVHWFWHIPGWGLGLLTAAAFIVALVTTNPGYYLLGVTLGLGVAIWCFVAIVFRKFFG